MNGHSVSFLKGAAAQFTPATPQTYARGLQICSAALYHTAVPIRVRRCFDWLLQVKVCEEGRAALSRCVFGDLKW